MSRDTVPPDTVRFTVIGVMFDTRSPVPYVVFPSVGPLILIDDPDLVNAMLFPERPGIRDSK